MAFPKKAAAAIQKANRKVTGVSKGRAKKAPTKKAVRNASVKRSTSSRSPLSGY